METLLDVNQSLTWTNSYTPTLDFGMLFRLQDSVTWEVSDKRDERLPTDFFFIIFTDGSVTVLCKIIRIGAFLVQGLIYFWK